MNNCMPSCRDKLDEMDRLLEIHNPPKLNHEGIEHLNRLINNEAESVIQNLTTKKSPGPDGLSGKFYQTFTELTPILKLT